MQQSDTRLHTWLVFTGALLVFGLRLTAFETRPTDVSALRVLAGDVPYRDFWTMYAPGSFVALAAAFRITGAQLIVSNLLGIVTAAAGVAVFFQLARLASRPLNATCLTALVAAAYFGSGYSDGFGSYPPAFLLLLLAVQRTVARADTLDTRAVVVPGLLLGMAALFKHDVAAYATLALGAALALVRLREGGLQALAPPVRLGLCAALIPLIAALVLILNGAGPDALTDLVLFPLGDFKYVRREYFPLVPHLAGSLVDMVRELRSWAVCNVPTVAAVAGLIALRRSRTGVDRRTVLLVTFSTLAFCLHWWAAHTQINTNAISLAAWGGLVGAAGLDRLAPPSRPRALTVAMVLSGWAALLVAEPVYLAAQRLSSETVWVGLPHLRGIRVTEQDAEWMRALASAIDEAAPAGAPLLFVSARNDMNIYALSVPFWLSDRRPATRHAELHPGITDVESTQRRMLAMLRTQPPPVVVREYRFDDQTLDRTRAEMQEHVPVGSTLLDDWIDERYVRGERFGAYEVMAPRAVVRLRATP